MAFIVLTQQETDSHQWKVIDEQIRGVGQKVKCHDCSVVGYLLLKNNKNSACIEHGYTPFCCEKQSKILNEIVEKYHPVTIVYKSLEDCIFNFQNITIIRTYENIFYLYYRDKYIAHGDISFYSRYNF